MAKTNLKLADPPARSPEREALHMAQQKVAAAEKRAADVAAAHERAQDDSIAAWQAVVAAETALEQAKADEPARLVARYLDPNAVVAAPSITEAEAAVAAARAKHEAAQQATTLLWEEKYRASDEAKSARDYTLRNAIAAAIAAD